MVTKIKINKTRCKRCNTTITSSHRHDFRTCPCGAISVDGGKDYLRRAWQSSLGTKDELIEELSEYYEENTEWTRT
ncbi:hypothetical protein UFOVP434_21 [uncultured Caudovirales phage]|uniref:DUF7695 domain-containing protein n=1 Tax=uncultured Caudovirales phage TaxID=2100421 RepID=A0A6J5MB43_9CAUD|nr:hypothetical protein UFOVP434_21 [uncultured Caudovirales phage]